MRTAVKKFSYLVTLICLLSAPNFSYASPTIVWDQTVDTTHATAAGVYSNNAYSQLFLEPVRFEEAVTITGIDTYTFNVTGALPGCGCDYGAVGTPVVITIATGSLLGPYQQIASYVSIRDRSGAPTVFPTNAGPNPPYYFVRVHADLPYPIKLKRGIKYWIGMSGNASEIGAAFMTNGRGPLLDNVTALFGYGGATIPIVLEYPALQIGDMQLRLWGRFEQ